MHTMRQIIKLISNVAQIRQVLIQYPLRETLMIKNKPTNILLSLIFHCENIFGSLQNEILSGQARMNFIVWCLKADIV